MFSRFCISRRALSTSSARTSAPIPVITVPKYLEHSIRRHERSQEREVEEIAVDRAHRGNLKVPVISSKKNPKLNFYLGQTYPNTVVNRRGRRRQVEIPLASQGWMKGGKYRGDIITFHRWNQNDFGVSKEALKKGNEQLFLTFDQLFLSEEMVDTLKTLGYVTPSHVQKEAIPVILNGSNVIVSGEAGSGKTIAYLAPILQMVFREKQKDSKINPKEVSPRALIIAPGRELTEQIGTIAKKLSFALGIGICTMISGASGSKLQQTGHDVIVTTAGLAAELAGKVYKLDRVQHLVLDEADTLLDDSFNEDILDVIRRLESANTKRGKRAQVLLVGATMPTEVKRVMGDFVGDSFVNVTTEMLHRPPSHVKQSFLRLHKYDRDAALLRIVSREAENNVPTLIFSNRTKTSNWITGYLKDNGIHCLSLNKTIPSLQRKDIFEQFQSGFCDFISCTDVASRGLDTQRVHHVINFECPFFISDYLHRVGRTGRLGSTGPCQVTTFVSFKPNVHLVQNLEHCIRTGKPLTGVEGNIAAQIRDYYDNKYRGGHD